MLWPEDKLLMVPAMCNQQFSIPHMLHFSVECRDVRYTWHISQEQGQVKPRNQAGDILVISHTKWDITCILLWFGFLIYSLADCEQPVIPITITFQRVKDSQLTVSVLSNLHFMNKSKRYYIVNPCLYDQGSKKYSTEREKQLSFYHIAYLCECELGLKPSTNACVVQDVNGDT